MWMWGKVNQKVWSEGELADENTRHREGAEQGRR